MATKRTTGKRTPGRARAAAQSSLVRAGTTVAQRRPKPMPELWRMGAGELAAWIARGDVSAAEAVESLIARIEAVDGALHAVCVRRYGEARSEARIADRRRAAGGARCSYAASSSWPV